MKRMCAIFLMLFGSGCSTAPVADFLDWVSPSPVRPQAVSPPPVAPLPPPAPKLIIQTPEAPPPAPPPSSLKPPAVDPVRGEREPMPPLPDISPTR